MNTPVTIIQTKDNKYRAACQLLPGCVVTADSYEDAEAQLVHAVENYMASLNVTHKVNMETTRSVQWSETAVATPAIGDSA